MPNAPRNQDLQGKPSRPFGIDPEPDAPGVETGIVTNLVSIAKAVRQIIGIKLAELDVLPGQNQLLLCLEQHGMLPVVDAADRLSVRASTVSKMADILGSKGWVVRSSDPADQRRVFLQLTDEGRALAAKVRAVETRFEVELKAALGDDDRIAPLLAHIAEVLAKRLNRLR